MECPYWGVTGENNQSGRNKHVFAGRKTDTYSEFAGRTATTRGRRDPDVTSAERVCPTVSFFASILWILGFPPPNPQRVPAVLIFCHID